MFYSRASEALFLFIQLSLAGSVAFGTYPSKPTVGGIIKKCGIIVFLPLFIFFVRDLLHGGYLDILGFVNPDI